MHTYHSILHQSCTHPQHIILHIHGPHTMRITHEAYHMKHITPQTARHTPRPAVARRFRAPAQDRGNVLHSALTGLGFMVLGSSQLTFCSRTRPRLLTPCHTQSHARMRLHLCLHPSFLAPVFASYLVLSHKTTDPVPRGLLTLWARALAHRVKRPRGAGSVGDRVGEGNAHASKGKRTCS